MLQMKDSYYIQIENYLKGIIFDTFYLPTLAIINDYMNFSVKLNSISHVITAIEDGSIIYVDNKFKGKFSIKISKELSKFAYFDARSKTWNVKDKSKVPSEVKAVAIKTESNNSQMLSELNQLYDNLETRFESNIEPTLTTPFESSLEKMKKELGNDFIKVGIKMQITPEQMESIIKDYNNNQTLNIKNWNFEQVQRLRDIVVKMNLQGFSKINLKKLIQKEWDVSSNKAKFLARQETSLFLSKFRREQSKKAGIKKYKWSTSQDERVRPDDGNKFTPGNNHKRLHGKVFYYGDPPIVDTKTGRKAEPGEDYNCRCVAIPIVE